MGRVLSWSSVSSAYKKHSGHKVLASRGLLNLPRALSVPLCNCCPKSAALKHGLRGIAALQEIPSQYAICGASLYVMDALKLLLKIETLMMFLVIAEEAPVVERSINALV